MINIIIIFLLIFTPFSFGCVETWSESVLELFAVFAIILLLFKQRNLHIKGYGIFSILIIILFQLMPLPSQSLYPFITRIELYKILSYLFIFVIIRTYFNSYKQIRRLIHVILFIGFSIAILTIIQKVTWNGKILWFRSFSANAHPVGPYINHNHFAGYMEMATPLALGVALTSGKKQKRFLFTFIFICMAATIFLSLSRGGVLSFLGSLFIMSIILLFNKNTRSKLQVILTITILLLLAVTWLGVDPLLNRLGTWRVDAEERIRIWRDTLGIIKDFPILGTGLGTFQYIYPKYKTIKTYALFDHAHNDYLEYLTELGKAGGLLILAGFLYYIKHIWKRILTTRDKSIAIIIISGFTSIVAILLHSITDFNLHIPANALLFTTILAITLNIADYRGERVTSAVNSNKFFRWGTFIIILVGLSLLYIRPVISNYYADRYFTKYTNQTTSISNGYFLLKQAIAWSPEKAECHFRLAKLIPDLEIKVEENPYDEYIKAIKLNPINAHYYFGMARYYISNLDKHSYADIINKFEKAIELDPTNYFFHKQYGKFAIIVYRQHDAGKNFLSLGINEYNKAIALNNASALVKEALEICFLRTKDYNKIKLIIPDIIDEKPFILAKFLIENDIWEKNKVSYLNDLKKAANKYEYYKGLSYYYFTTGDYRKEIQVLEDYLKLDPNNTEAHSYLAQQASGHKGMFIPEYIQKHFKNAKKNLDYHNENNVN